MRMLALAAALSLSTAAAQAANAPSQATFLTPADCAAALILMDKIGGDFSKKPETRAAKAAWERAAAAEGAQAQVETAMQVQLEMSFRNPRALSQRATVCVLDAPSR